MSRLSFVAVAMVCATAIVVALILQPLPAVPAEEEYDDGVYWASV